MQRGMQPVILLSFNQRACKKEEKVRKVEEGCNFGWWRKRVVILEGGGRETIRYMDEGDLKIEKHIHQKGLRQGILIVGYILYP